MAVTVLVLALGPSGNRAMAFMVVVLTWNLVGCARITRNAHSPTRMEGLTPRQLALSKSWDLSFDVVVSSDNCPQPGTNATTRVGPSIDDLAFRKAFDVERHDQEASMLIDAAFGLPVLVAIRSRQPEQGERCSDGCDLVVMSARTDFWPRAVKQVTGRCFETAAEEGSGRGDSDVLGPSVDEVRVPLASSLAKRLLAVWDEVLHRTAYPREHLYGPNGQRVLYGKADGVRYEFSSELMSGEIHSPREGSLMWEFAALGGMLANARRGAEREFWSRLSAKVGLLERRLETREACEVFVPAYRR